MQKILLFGSEDEKFDVLDVIASLHNVIYQEVTCEYYDYMFHWANLGYGGDPDDGLFKEEKKNDMAQESND